MSNENGLQRITENELFTLLQPKQEDLLRMIGLDRMKREISFALQAVNSSEMLSKCTTQSIGKSIYNLALTGLSLNPVLKLSYLTPRWNKALQVNEANLTPSYQGLTKLVADTGSVISIYAYPVYKGDIFEVTLGTEVNVIHKPKNQSKEITDAYAVAILPDGSKIVEQMSIAQVYDIRERSDTYQAYVQKKIKSCTWVTDEGEMVRKTLIKRITKYIPKTDRWLQVQEAINIDNQDYPATFQQQEYVLSLINSSTYDQDMRDILIDKVEGGISAAEASTMIEDLKNNQLDPVRQGIPGGYYSTTQAKEAAAQDGK